MRTMAPNAVRKIPITPNQRSPGPLPVNARLPEVAFVDAGLAALVVDFVPAFEELEPDGLVSGPAFVSNEIGTMMASPPTSPSTNSHVAPAAACAGVGGHG